MGDRFVERCRKEPEDFEKQKDTLNPVDHNRICSFIDTLDVHPKKPISFEKVFLNDDKKLNISLVENDDLPEISVLKSEPADGKLVFSAKSSHRTSRIRAEKLKQPSSSKNKLFSFNNKSKSKKISTKPSKPEIKKTDKSLEKKPKKSLSKSRITKKKKEKKKPIFKRKKKKTKKEKQRNQIIAEKTKQQTSSSKDTIEQLKQKVMNEQGFMPTIWEEIDFYDLHSPFVYISVIKNKETKDRRYLVLEQTLSSEEEKKFQFILDALATYSISADEIEGRGSKNVLQKEVNEIIADYGLSLSDFSKEKIYYEIQKNLLGFGKINSLMQDPHIEDISCDGAGLPLFLYHRDHGSIQSNVQFNDEDELSGFVMRLAQKCGKHISIAHPMIDATMPDGSRIQMTLSTEVSTKGSTFTIRKFREQPFSPADLIRFNSFSSEMIAYFWLAVEHGVNGLIAGGTAAGKTSTLNALALFIPRESKIVSIEETREVNLPHPNWIPGVSRSGFGDVVAGKMAGEIDLYDLMKAALRQRPEYILVGEIRGREAYVLFQAMATGHTTYSTVHADSTKSLIHRLEGEPINIPRIMLQSLDVVCLQTIARVKNKRARRCKQVIEIIDIDPTTKEILTNEVFRWDPIEDTFKYSGKSYVLEQIRNETNQSREEITAELKQRAKVLEWMVEHKIHLFEEVASLTAQYYEHPDDVLKMVKGEP
mgnify:CR=1 FL=1